MRSFLMVQNKAQFAALAFILFCAFFLVIAPVTPRPFAFWPFFLGFLGSAGLPLLFKKKLIFDRGLFLFLFLTTFLAFSSILWSVNPSESLERSLKITLLFSGGFFLLAFVQTLKAEQYKNYLWILPVASLIGLIILIGERSFDYPIYRILRPENIKAHDYVINKATAILVLTLWPVLFMAFTVFRYKGVIFLSVAVAFLLFFSESQSSQLAFLAILFFAFIFPYRFKAAWIALGAFIGFCIMAGPWLAHFAFENFADSLWQPGILRQSSASMRLEIWDFIAKRIFDNPFYGFGIEATRFIEDFQSEKRFFNTNTVMHPHSAVFQLWIEFGILGATMGYAFILYLLRKIYKQPLSKQKLYLPVFMGILCTSMIGWGLWQSWWIGLVFTSTSLTILAGHFLGEREPD